MLVNGSSAFAADNARDCQHLASRRPDVFHDHSEPSTNAAATYSYTSPSTSTVITVNIGRDVPYGSYPFNSKEFAYNNSGFTPQPSPDYQSSDLDISAIYNAAALQSYAYVVLYALAYGYEAGTSVVEYSTPVYIGYIQITPFP